MLFRRESDPPAPVTPTRLSAAGCIATCPAPPPPWRCEWPFERRATGRKRRRIQEWLGHSDIGTTGNIYTHLDYSSKVSSAQAIVGILPGAK